MRPCALTCWGAMWNVVAGLVKWPVSRLLIAIVMVKFVLAGMVSPFAGDWNFDDGIFVCAAMTPIGVWLHEPSRTCWPFVFSLSGKRRQKLMKLLVDVIEGSWPAVAFAEPS